MAETGWLERPEYAQLYDTVGLVSAIWISQEGDTDDLYFKLEVTWREGTDAKTFRIPLYMDTAVALAQLQLLRDALRWACQPGNAPVPLVRVHFNFVHATAPDGARINEEAYVYWLQIVDMGTRGYPVEDFYSRTTPTTWYVSGYPLPS